MEAVIGAYEGVTALGMAEDDTNGGVDGLSEDSTTVDDGYTTSGKVDEKVVDDTSALLVDVELADEGDGCEEVIGVANEELDGTKLDLVVVFDTGVEGSVVDMVDDTVTVLGEMVVSNVGVDDGVVLIAEEDKNEPSTSLEDMVDSDVVTGESVVEWSCNQEISGGIPKVLDEVEEGVLILLLLVVLSLVVLIVVLSVLSVVLSVILSVVLSVVAGSV